MGLTRTLNMFKNIENWDEYLIYKFGGKKAPTFTFKMRNKVSVSVPRQVIPEFKESVFEDVYFKHLPKELLHLKNPTLLDIGANVGFFTLYALFKLNNPQIISFEPIKRNFAVLQKNIAGLKSGNVTLVNKAVNNTAGELVLRFKAQEITTSASLFDNQAGGEEEVVTTTTLEDIFAGYKLSKIDLLKMDCEGAEYNIIYNTPAGFFNKVNCISMETHLGKGEKENNNSLARYIEGLGFKVITKGEDFIWAYKEPQQWV